MEESLEQNKVEFSTSLGLKETISDEAFVAAMNDKTYAHNLLINKDQPGFLSHLLENPPQQNFKTNTITKHSNIKLVKNAGKALSNWAKTGFARVELDQLKAREDACLSCEYRIKPTSKIQKLVVSQNSDKIGHRAADSTCNLCGCSISKKIKIPTESCPAKDPKRKGYNLWGEPIKSGSTKQ